VAVRPHGRLPRRPLPGPRRCQSRVDRDPTRALGPPSPRPGGIRPAKAECLACVGLGPIGPVRRGALAGSVAAASPSPAGTPDDGSSLCIDDNLAHVLIDDAITRTTPLTLTGPAPPAARRPDRRPTTHPRPPTRPHTAAGCPPAGSPRSSANACPSACARPMDRHHRHRRHRAARPRRTRRHADQPGPSPAPSRWPGSRFTVSHVTARQGKGPSPFRGASKATELALRWSCRGSGRGRRVEGVAASRSNARRRRGARQGPDRAPGTRCTLLPYQTDNTAGTEQFGVSCTARAVRPGGQVAVVSPGAPPRGHPAGAVDLRRGVYLEEPCRRLQPIWPPAVHPDSDHQQDYAGYSPVSALPWTRVVLSADDRGTEHRGDRDGRGGIYRWRTR
jgi:hypothetical protein